MEDGTVILVGATTENPSFELNAALLSRARVLVFQPLGEESDRRSARSAPRRPRASSCRSTTRRGRCWSRMADGDGRAALTLAEEVWRAAKPGEVFDAAGAAGGRAAACADLRQGPGRPLQSDLGAAQIGARLRSRRRALLSRPHARRRRGSALSRPPRWCAWRSRISAWPTRRRWSIANAAKDAYDYLGSPEGELAFAEACVYLATAPKSNAVYTAFKAATAAAKETRLAAAARSTSSTPRPS